MSPREDSKGPFHETSRHPFPKSVSSIVGIDSYQCLFDNGI